MYAKIMTPVDLGHVETLDRALRTTADLARHYGAPVVYVGVTAQTPGPVAHTPKEFAGKLDAFAAQQAQANGIEAAAHAVVSHDPAVDVDDALMKALDETGADLVVMASHVPTLADYVWPSNGGKIAQHAKASVFVVR